MFGFTNVTTNVSGVPYLRTNGITVSAETVDFSLGFRRIPSDAIPTGTTGTLPIRLTLNGQTRNLTSFGGDNVTAADITGTGVITVFYDYFSGTLQLVSSIA